MPKEPLREKLVKNIKPTAEERETIVRFDDSCNTAVVYTCNRGLQQELKKKGYTLVDKSTNDSTYEVDKRYISFRTVRGEKKAKIND